MNSESIIDKVFSIILSLRKIVLKLGICGRKRTGNRAYRESAEPRSRQSGIPEDTRGNSLTMSSKTIKICQIQDRQVGRKQVPFRIFSFPEKYYTII